MYFKTIFLIFQILISFTYSELSLEKKDKLLNGFIDFYNNLPNQIYTCEEGTLQSADQLDDNCYKIDVNLRVADVHNLDSTKFMKCTATVQDLQDQGVSVASDNYQCQENEQSLVTVEVVVTEPAFERKPVHLDNEVETNAGVTSGEQFIAVPREEPGAPCIGCATHINPQAAGVTELATLAVRHLDRHEPNVKHTLNTVLDVERQVQVVNGVRYILTILVDYNNCTTTEIDNCLSSNVCKISILEKPWVRLPRGGKYRAILTNNCTEEWQFGDNGEVINENESNNRENNEIDANTKKQNADDDIIKAVHTDDIQAQQNQGRPLTDSDIKQIEEQIIPHSQFSVPSSTERGKQVIVTRQSETVSKDHAFKETEIPKYHNENTISQTDRIEQSSLTEERKKTIEELMQFFEFSAFGSERNSEKNGRSKRSYDHDLQAMLLTEDFQSLQKSIRRGRYLYNLAQTMVDYLNEMDLEIKTRTLSDVIKADDEIVNYQHFYYLQARVTIPCDKAICEPKDTTKKICNGVIDGTDKKHPHVLSAFCYNELEETELNKVKSIPFNDPVLSKLLKESVKKIESESSKTNALNISKIVSATTQKVSGTLTKISIVLNYLNCTKSTPLGLRRNCSSVADLGSNVCEVVIYEKKQFKQHKITYNCIERTVDTTYGELEKKQNVSIDDIKVKEMVQEALQYLELQSNRNNKQKVVTIKSVATQLNAGLVTEIEFIVGYTLCKSNTEVDVSTCPLLASEPLRECKAQIWDRTWIEDGRQTEVQCDDMSDKVEEDNVSQHRKKRSLDFVGGPTPKDVNEPKYKLLAEESLSNYLKTSEVQQHYRLIKVNQVTVQIVAGTVTRISFTVSPTDCRNKGDGQPISTKCNITDSANTSICHSKIWERPWLEKKEITVDCILNDYNKREKRETLGGETEKNPNDPEFKQLAEESLQKYLQSIGSTKPHKVLHVEKASVQVVAGTLTRIDFVVVPLSSNSGDQIKCHSKIWDRPWLNKKEITVDCKINDQVYRAKRQIPGGQQTQDPNNPRYMSLAEESLKKYLQTTGNTKPHRIVRVDSVTTQVVSGTVTRIYFSIVPTDQESGDLIKCLSKVYEQPWTNTKEIDVDCHIDNGESRAKRYITGGIVEEDPNKPEFTQLAEESLQKYLQTTGNPNPHKVVRVEKASVQLVAGTLTRIDFVVVPLNSNSDDLIKCHSEIWDRPWLNKKETTVDCKVNDQVYRAKRQIPGGQQTQDPNNPRYMSLAAESLKKYLQTTGNTKPHRIVRVDSVTTQVVSGTVTRIYFSVVPTDQETGDLIKCFSKVYEQPWTNTKEIDVNCQIKQLGTRLKREILNTVNSKRERVDKKRLRGHREDQDPQKTQYKLLAKDSLSEYERLKKSDHAHKVIEVKRVTTQIVAGIIYEIDFTAVPTTCSPKIFDASICKQKKGSETLLCHARIWSQPWDKSKETTIACKPETTQRIRRNLDVDSEFPLEENDIKSNIQDKRQAFDDVDVIDEELKYYYADRAMQHINQMSNTNNLDKLISVHSVDSSVHMGANMVRLYIETAPTYCIKRTDDKDLPHCEELDGINHKLCLARLWPSPVDELVVQSISVVCDDDKNFASVTGLSIPDLLTDSIKQIEGTSDQKYKMVHLGEPQIVPSLDSNIPLKISFVVGFTNCTKDVDLRKSPFDCFLDSTKSSKPCTSYIWFVPNSREINQIDVKCASPVLRKKRSVPTNLANATADDLEIHKLVQESLEKLEMASIHRYKQRLLLINSYSTKITTGKVTTIDFDVGYTSCLKYEWVDDITTCEFLEHLPRRHCVAEIFERLWLENGKNIEVNCEDDETPLEAHIEFESADMAMQLAKDALRHIEAKYPHPQKQKVVRIFSLEKQVVAGIHYRLKVEIGTTDCPALSARTDCKLVKADSLNKFCRVNVWLRPWTDHPPNYRVTCDYNEAATAEVYHQLQAEHLFYDFLSTYKPEYVNDRNEMRRRFDIFKDNVRKMHELNVHERGTATYGVTRFADLTYEEFTTRHMGLKTSLRDSNQVPFSKANIPEVSLPESFDWRDHGAVTEVKDQGSCGSCWAFSVTGNIEGQWKRHSGKLLSLSEQELVDCDKLDQGCNGGLPDNAYRAIEQLGGLEAETDYPYEGSDDKCTFNKTLARVQISGAVNISSNETEMAKWLVQNGPISIGINANAMQFYFGGISHPWRLLCDPSNMNHGVLIVGYGVKDYPLFHKRLPYWIVKNSWGTSWGEQGYYRVYRGDGTCGLNTMASSAVI